MATTEVVSLAAVFSIVTQRDTKNGCEGDCCTTDVGISEFQKLSFSKRGYMHRGCVLMVLPIFNLV